MGPGILDIDLDLFSTLNPGIAFLKEAGLSDADIRRIDEIFSPENLRLSKVPEKRAREIQSVREGMVALATGSWRDAIPAVFNLFRRGIGPLELYESLQIIDRLDPKVDFGSFIENAELAIGLPRHLASEEEIDTAIRRIGELIAAGTIQPRLITIARSAEGGFTPIDRWPGIEQKFLKLLREALGDFFLVYDEGVLPIQNH